jgi:hypothetical protein
MLLTASMPVESGNAASASGTLGSTIQKILGEMKPEAAYFVAEGGERTAFVFFDMKDSSELTSIAEPWFLAFNARVSVRPAMNPQDLAAGLPGMQQAVKNYAKAAGV